MQGYFANPEQTERALVTDSHGDTWLRTGDVVRCDEEGYFYVLDRKKDMIIRAGLKVYPGKVEKLLKTHKRIADAAVVGRADGAHTEKVVAVCVASSPLAEGEEQKLVEEVRALCREHLAPYEVPAVVEFREALPRSALGKLLKRELREPPPEKPQPSPGGKPGKDKDKEKTKAASSTGKEAA
jgi:long-chain acyl-CoA synthetase